MTDRPRSAEADGRDLPSRPARPPRRRVLASLAGVAGAAAALAAVNWFRQDHLTSDQFSVAAIVQKDLQGDLYGSDPTYGDPRNYDFYLPWYRRLLGGVHGLVGGDLGRTYWAVMAASTTIMLVGFWGLFLWLGVRPAWSAGGAVLAALPRLAPMSEITGAGLIETALPRTLFGMLMPVVLGVFFRSRGRGPLCVLACLMTGLLANAHPQTGMFLTAALLGMVLYVHRGRLRGWATAAAGGVAALVGVLPFILNFQWRVPGGVSGSAVIARLPASGLSFGACVAPMVLAAWLARPRGRPAGFDAARVSMQCMFILLGIAVVGGLLDTVTWSLGLRGWVSGVSWLRSGRLVAPLAMVAAVGWLGGARARGLSGRSVLVVALSLLPTAATVGGLEYVFRQRYAPMKAPARAAAETTPAGALLVAPPYGAEAVRAWSRRSVLWAKCDLHFQRTGNRGPASQVVEQLRLAYRDKDLSALTALARRHGAGYLVLPPEWGEVPLAGRDGLYELPPAAAAATGPAGEGRLTLQPAAHKVQPID